MKGDKCPYSEPQEHKIGPIKVNPDSEELIRLEQKIIRVYKDNAQVLTDLSTCADADEGIEETLDEIKEELDRTQEGLERISWELMEFAMRIFKYLDRDNAPQAAIESPVYVDLKEFVFGGIQKRIEECETRVLRIKRKFQAVIPGKKASYEPGDNKKEFSAPTPPSVAIQAVSRQVFKLNVTEEQGCVIREIITTTGQATWSGLVWNAIRLRALGAELGKGGVGPLQFLAYIFSQDELKSQMKNIKDDSLKWNSFIGDIASKLTNAASTEHFYEELFGFAQTVGVELAALKGKAEAKDWSGFVACLVA